MRTLRADSEGAIFYRHSTLVLRLTSIWMRLGNAETNRRTLSWPILASTVAYGSSNSRTPSEGFVNHVFLQRTATESSVGLLDLS